MAALAWLLIPLVAAVAASLWGSWVGRRRIRTPDAAGVAGYERFRAAMERSSASGTATAAHPGAESSDVSAASLEAASTADAVTADGVDHMDAVEAKRSARRRRRKGERELASAGAMAHASPDGPAREAG